MASISPEKVETYRAVCRLERQGATPGERESAKRARERFEAKYPGIIEAAAQAADAEHGPANSRGGGRKPVETWSFRDFVNFAIQTSGSVKEYLDSLAADAEVEGDIADIMGDVVAETMATKGSKKTPGMVVWRFKMDAEDFADLAELCGPDMDADTWKSAAKAFGEMAQEVFLETFAVPDDGGGK